MDSAYIKALEIRTTWLRWAKGQGRDAWGTLDDMASKIRQNSPIVSQRQPWMAILPTYQKTLEAGDTFFMNRKFGSLVDHARQSIPDDLVFEDTWMQAKQGWMWIEDPFLVPTVMHEEKDQKLQDVLGTPIKISAIGWAPVPEGSQTKNGRIAGPGAYVFLCFQNFQDYKSSAIGFGCWSYFMLQNGDKLIDRIHQFEARAREEGGAYGADRARDVMHEIRWIYAAYYLMSQRLAITVHHDTDRATRRRAEKEGQIVSPFIRVISLRRLEKEREKNPHAVHVDWQWQWEVRGHWKNQFYPSTGEHKPVFIEAYIKGPENKPLKDPGHRLFLARR